MPRTLRTRILAVLGVVALACISVVLAAPRIICHGGDNPRWVKARADIFAIEEAIESYRIDHGSLPENIGQLAVADSNRPPYLQYVPSDPWGRSYEYVSDGQQYSIVSSGADGTRGGSDANADIDNHSSWADQP